jgi:hypothetical protein
MIEIVVTVANPGSDAAIGAPLYLSLGYSEELDMQRFVICRLKLARNKPWLAKTK